MSKSELDPARHRWRQRSLRRRRREQTLAMHRYQQQQEDPMSKKPVVELVVEPVVEEPKPAGTPSYPGELPPLDLSPEQIASLDASRDAMSAALLGGYTPPKPAQPVVAEPEAEQPVFEPGPDLELAGSLVRAKAEILNLQRMHDEAMTTALTVFQQKMSAAMGEVARLEQKTRATIDLDEAARLRAVVEAMKEDKAGDAARLARMSEGEARQHQLRRSAAHALQIAAESRKQLAVYAAEYNDMLEALTMVTREDWLLGIAPERANVSIPLANSLTTSLSLIRDLRAGFEGALATDSVRVYDGEPCGGYQKQIQILIDDAAREPPSHEGLP